MPGSENIGTRMYWPTVPDHRSAFQQASTARSAYGGHTRRPMVYVEQPPGEDWEHGRWCELNAVIISPRSSSPRSMYSSITGALGLDYSLGGGVPGSADNECQHGRLPGDRCPSPRVHFDGRRLADGSYVGPRWEQNWPHPHPCGCWPQEAVVRATPDPFATASPQVASGHRTHAGRPKAVPVPRVPVKGGQRDNESTRGRSGRRSAAARAEAA